MKKRFLSVLLAGALSLSAVAGTIFSASATRNTDDTYTPSAGVETYNYQFAMPGVWVNDVTEKTGNACGTYWWSGSDCPSYVFSHEWPGYKMNKDPEVENLYNIDVPTNTPVIIFNNYIDCGVDSCAPQFDAACQALDKNVEYFSWDDSDYYTDEFWEYVYSVAMEELDIDYLDFYDDYDEINEVISYYAENLKFEVFGDYASNFFYSEEAGCIVYNCNNMIFVVDLRPEMMSVSCQIVPEGKVTYGGEFFFSYGGGKYGIWPTLELAVEKEGLTLDEEGNVVTDGLEVITYDSYGNPDSEAVKALDGLALDKYDNIVKRITSVDVRTGLETHRLVYVYGDFTGKYWETRDNFEVPEATEPTTAPDKTGATTPSIPSGDSNKIYFQVDPNIWNNFRYITFYLYDHDTSDNILVWGSKKGNMTNEGNNLWSYDFDEKGITLEPNKQYGCIFTADWGVHTCDLIIGTECLGDTAYCTGIRVENNVDANKKSYYVKWKNADSTKYAPPLCVTSIGNVVGEALWEGTTEYDLLLDFIMSGLKYALKFNGKTAQQTIDDVAKDLGLSQEDVDRALAEAKAAGYDWTTEDPTPKPPVSLGDVDCDGKIDVTDATYIQISVADLISLSYEEKARADVNHDGIIDVTDATFIQMLVAELIDSFE